MPYNYTWSDTWQLSMSHKKCCTTQIRALQREIKLQLGKNAISTVNEVRDLGVIIDNDLKLTAHVNDIVAKAHSRACLIHKS